MEPVNIHQAKTNLSRLIERAQSGEEVIISKAGKPVAKLSAIQANSKPRMLGLLKGKLKLAADLDDPLPSELLDAFRS
ncbi:hypothetical protein BH11CYA1_BH11CYA1_06790 [soil metagenome]